MYRDFSWGSAVDIIVLDQRSFRSAAVAGACTAGANPDPVPGLARPETPQEFRALRAVVGLPPELPPGCLEALDDPSRTMLGDEQLDYFKDWLRSSDATWKVVVNEVAMQALLAQPYDSWEGYAAERRQILEFIRDEGIDNVVFLTTDAHANIFGPVRLDPFAEPDAIAYEAIAGPIATDTLQGDAGNAAGESAAGILKPFLEGVVRVDCAELDSYAYALVEVDAEAGTMTITAKDAAGAELCRTELEAAE
jgi:phosphodiesterase/alkaline phosphatase D-like protein